jgi:hypothetical protein
MGPGRAGKTCENRNPADVRELAGIFQRSGALDFYTEWKAVCVDYSDRLQRSQIDRPASG